MKTTFSPSPEVVKTGVEKMNNLVFDKEDFDLLIWIVAKDPPSWKGDTR